MSAYMTKVCIYYKDAKGKEQMALADTVVTDMPDDVAERHIANGHLREATKGEVAEFAPAASAKKTSKPKKADEETGDGGDTKTEPIKSERPALDE